MLVIRPKIFEDERGGFFESYNTKTMASLGINEAFVQDNQSHSVYNVLRGLHYQTEHQQGKLVRVVRGGIWDVAVDMRRESSCFGQWVAEYLSSSNRNMLWIPAGFAHGFRVLSYTADVMYKATDFYSPEYERTVLWNDKDLGIDWGQNKIPPIVSEKDKHGFSFKECR